MSNTDMLTYFCKAAGHEPCPNWETHRFELDKIDMFVHMLLDRIPDALATGKAVQKASRSGQLSLTQEVPPPPEEVIDFRDSTLEPVDVHWYLDVVNGTDDETIWKTDDPHIKDRTSYYRQDCRKVSILTYKPRRVKLFFDGVPDEWNEWR